MEFVAKRKREGENVQIRTHDDAFPELPDSIKVKLNSLKKRNEYELSRKEPEFADILDRHDLSPEKISKQLEHAARKGKSPLKLQAIMSFLMNHYNSVVNGDPPIPLESKFRKVPFL